MKKTIISCFILGLCFSVFSQEAKGQPSNEFQFTTVKEIPITSVKNQSSSGTCWSFSGLGMVEAELLRMGKGEFDFSEMFVVHRNYADKAKKYVRMHGETTFAGGGSFADVLDCIRDYGIVPETALPGLNYGDTIHRHGEMDQLLSAYMSAVIKNPNRKLSTAWFNAYEGILDTYLGACPDKFVYGGKEYTPQSFVAYLGFKPEDYISITSFTHHPFYTAFPIEVPDNWRWALSYNVPLNEMMEIVDNAIDKCYTIAWATDVSERGFNRKGIAVIPDMEAKEGPGSDQAHWLGLSTREREAIIAELTSPVPEKAITQEMRQIAFDNYETTDDHGMLIYGTAKDQNGTKYYMIKNSWGTDNPYKGTWYASSAFMQYKTLSIVLHKNAIPSALKKKLGIN